MRKGPNHKTLSCSVTTGLIRLISLVWVAGWSTNYRASFTTVRFTVDLVCTSRFYGREEEEGENLEQKQQGSGTFGAWTPEYMNIHMSI